MVASSGEKCVQLTVLKNLSAADQAKAMKVHGLKIVKTNFADEHFELVFSFQVHLSFHGYPQSSQMNSSLCLYLHVIVGVGCKLFIRHFHAASFVNKIKRFLTPFRLVSTCILFIKKSPMRSGTCSSMWLVCERKILFYGELWRKLLTKLKYLITAWPHSNNPLQRKHSRRKLVFTVAGLLKGNRSSFSSEWVSFSKSEIALAEAARAISAFWKTHSCKLIPNWTRNRMITIRIERHEVLLSINHKIYNFRAKENSQVMKKGENSHWNTDKEGVNILR